MTVNTHETIEAVARTVQTAVNDIVANAGNEVLIMGGMKNMTLTGKSGKNAVEWPLDSEHYYILVSVPVGTGQCVTSGGILGGGITPITVNQVMA